MKQCIQKILKRNKTGAITLVLFAGFFVACSAYLSESDSFQNDVNHIEQKNPTETDFPKKTFTVTFNTDGADEEIEAQTVEENEKATEKTPTKYGYTFLGWYDGSEKFDFDTKITADITLTAKWEKIDENATAFNVTFFSDGGSEIDAQLVLEGKTATKPENPEKEGYTFAGWFSGDDEFDFSTILTQDVQLLAHWTENVYTITFDANGGSINTNTQEIEASGQYLSTVAELGISHEESEEYKYSFLGWAEESNADVKYENGAKFTPKEDTTLYAVWKKIPYYNLIFTITKNGEEISTLKTHYASDETPLLLPTTANDASKRIDQNENAQTQIPEESEEVSKTLSWTDQNGNAQTEIPEGSEEVWEFSADLSDFPDDKTPYLVRHIVQNIDDDNYSVYKIEILTGVANNNTSAQPLPELNEKGFSAQSVNQSNISKTSTTTVEIKYTRPKRTYTIILNGGEVESSPKIVDGKITARQGTKITIDTPTKKGYTFQEWKPSAPASPIEIDKQYTAEFKIVEYSITYKLNGGSWSQWPSWSRAGTNPSSYTVEESIELPVPYKFGYTFKGWYLDEKLTEKITKIEQGTTGNLTLYAKWTNNFSSFNLDVKEEYENVTITIPDDYTSSTVVWWVNDLPYTGSNVYGVVVEGNTLKIYKNQMTKNEYKVVVLSGTNWSHAITVKKDE